MLKVLLNRPAEGRQEPKNLEEFSVEKKLPIPQILTYFFDGSKLNKFLLGNKSKLFRPFFKETSAKNHWSSGELSRAPSGINPLPSLDGNLYKTPLLVFIENSFENLQNIVLISS